MATPPERPPLFILPPLSNTHHTTLILLHGTSQTGPTFAEQLLSFPIPINGEEETKTLQELLPDTKFVSPTGSRKYVTVLEGEGHAWFDFESFEDRTLGLLPLSPISRSHLPSPY